MSSSFVFRGIVTCMWGLANNLANTEPVRVRLFCTTEHERKPSQTRGKDGALFSRRVAFMSAFVFSSACTEHAVRVASLKRYPRT